MVFRMPVTHESIAAMLVNALALAPTPEEKQRVALGYLEKIFEEERATAASLLEALAVQADLAYHATGANADFALEQLLARLRDWADHIRVSGPAHGVMDGTVVCRDDYSDYFEPFAHRRRAAEEAEEQRPDRDRARARQPDGEPPPSTTGES